MENCDWARMDAATTDGLAQGMIQLEPAFVERFGADISRENLEILDRLTRRAEPYWRYARECKNQVSVHADFRGDNMLFGERGMARWPWSRSIGWAR